MDLKHEAPVLFVKRFFAGAGIVMSGAILVEKLRRTVYFNEFFRYYDKRHNMC
jgi:hypothetical protein